MRIELAFREDDARAVTYYLQRRYKSKAQLAKLAMVAIRREVAKEAEAELADIDKDMERERTEVKA